MTNGNLQTRISQLRYYYIFSLSLILSVLITNIQGFISLYIFLLSALVGLNMMFWSKFSYKYIVVLILWIMSWFYISNHNSDIIANNRKIIFTSYPKSPLICRISDVYKNTALEKSYICTLQKIWNNPILVNANILVKMWAWSKLKIWDIIKTDSSVQKIKNSDDFNYENYLLLKNIYWQANVMHAEIIWKDIAFFESSILDLKNKITGTINWIYPWDSAKLLSWIFLWTKADFSWETWQNFQRAWLSHIVAVSWFNITILIVFLSIIFRFLPDLMRVAITVFCVAIFIVLVWNNSSALRAAIMWVLAFLAMSRWRKVNIYSIMVLTIMIFTLLNPMTLNYDIWFHLSFLALLWLLCFSETMAKTFFFLPEKFSIRESIATTIAVLLFTLPIMVVNFWTISIISPISNLLTTPAIPLIMLLWFISMIAYNIIPIVWILIWFLNYSLLEYILKVAQYLWGLDYSVINIDLGAERYYFSVIYYVFLLMAVLEINSRTKAKLQSPQDAESAVS